MQKHYALPPPLSPSPRTSVAYRRAIEANPTFPFTPEDDVDADGAPANESGAVTPSFAPALVFLQVRAWLAGCCSTWPARQVCKSSRAREGTLALPLLGVRA